MTKTIDLATLNYYEQEPEDNTFQDIFVDITHRCNMECKNCYLPTRTPPDMQLEKFKEFVKRIKGKCMIRIVGAEPTLHPHCVEFIKAALGAGHLCILITNGLRLSSESYVKKLQDTGLQHVYISMNGVDKNEWYQEIDDMPCAKKKLKAFKNIANKFSIDVGTIIVKGVNEGAPKRMMDLIKEHNVQNITMRIKNVGQIGRYMEDETENMKLEDLVKLCSEQFNLPEKYIWDFYKTNHRYAGAPEVCGIEFPLDQTQDPKFRYQGRWVKLTNWDTDNEVGIPDPGSTRRGRITPEWKIAPFYEHLKLNEDGSGY